MSGKSFIFAATLALTLSVGVAFSQVATTKKVVVNPDGSYSVIEYPVGKEVVLNLTPAGTITGKGVVHMIVTDLCVFQRDHHDRPFRLVELAPGVTAEEVREKTTANYVD